MENVITEIRVVETDDGFRIEVKGDKEKLRPFFTGMGVPEGWHRGPWRTGKGRWGFGFPPGFMMHMGPWWGGWGFEPEEERPGPKEA
jgi:hypothetical protein